MKLIDKTVKVPAMCLPGEHLYVEPSLGTRSTKGEQHHPPPPNGLARRDAYPSRHDPARPPMRHLMTAVIALLAVAATATGCAAAPSPGAPPPIRFASSTHAAVAYAVDGDTLRVRLPSGDLDYVRLVGIDTPEDVRPGYPTECGARAAAASMDHLAPEGAPLTLRPDSVAGAEDRYGRLLAHAFVDGRQLEIAQLRRGLAYVYRYEDQRFDGVRRFEAVANAARKAARGSWGRCNGDFHSAEPGVQG